MTITKLKYKSLLSDVGSVRRSSRVQATAVRHTPLGRPLASTNTPHPMSATLPPALDSARSIRPPAYQSLNQRSRKTVKVYPMPEGDQVLSVTIRLRGDYDGEILTTTATFHAYDGLQNQIQSTLLKNFGKGAIGIATPRGKVIIEDWQIYQLAYPGVSSAFCDVVYSREDEHCHTPILGRASKLLLEVDRKNFDSVGSNLFMFLDPNENYKTVYADQAGLKFVAPEDVGVQKDLAIRKGYYYQDMGGLPSYNEVDLFRFGSACYSADCSCCQGWMRSQGGTSTPQRARRQIPRWRGIDLQDYDGLTLEERRFLLRARRWQR